MQATIQSINLISIDPNIRNGRPWIAGTSIEVSVIVIAKIVQGLEPDEIAADYELSLKYMRLWPTTMKINRQLMHRLVNAVNWLRK